MSQERERVYTIPLGKVLLSPDNRRAKRAINMIKEFTRHHMKTDNMRIDEDLAHSIWSRGIKKPPRKIRVKMTMMEDGIIIVAPYDEVMELKSGAALESGTSSPALATALPQLDQEVQPERDETVEYSEPALEPSAAETDADQEKEPSEPALETPEPALETPEPALEPSAAETDADQEKEHSEPALETSEPALEPSAAETDADQENKTSGEEKNT